MNRQAMAKEIAILLSKGTSPEDIVIETGYESDFVYAVYDKYAEVKNAERTKSDIEILKETAVNKGVYKGVESDGSFLGDLAGGLHLAVKMTIDGMYNGMSQAELDRAVARLHKIASAVKSNTVLIQNSTEVVKDVSFLESLRS